MLGQRVEDLNDEAIERLKKEKQILSEIGWIKSKEEWNSLSEKEK